MFNRKLCSFSRRLLAPWVAALCLSACGRYADFALPRPAGGPTVSSYQWIPEPAPVIARGSTGAFDSVDALNPSVVLFSNHYVNLYSGFDGNTWHTGLAVSADGRTWTKQAKVLSPDPKTWEGGYIAANGAALEVDGRLMYWYHAGPREHPRLGLATSADGRVWAKHPAPVVGTGPRGSWDERGVADPYVIREDGEFFLFYLGQDRARRQRLGIARSRDGIVWEKLRANPVLELGGPGEFDENGLGEPAVWQEGGSYWMLYTGRDRSEIRRLGFARSSDGVTWEKLARPVIAGGQIWNRAVLCDPTVLRSPGGWMVWFGGGSVPRPDERIEGQVGLAVLQPVLVGRAPGPAAGLPLPGRD